MTHVSTYRSWLEKKLCCPGGLSRGGLRFTVKANDDGKTNPGEGAAG